MFAAFAIGAPAGSALYAAHGFAAIAIATAVAPLGTLLLVAPLPAVAPVQHARLSFRKVIGAVWVPGLGSALGSVGFGAVTTFVALLFAAHGWANGWLAYTAYAVAFILARIFLSHLADAIGGAKVALVFALVEAAGQALLWLAVRPEMALAGAALTGFRLLAGLPWLWRRSGPSRPGAESWPGDGSLHRLPHLAQGIASPALGLIASGATLNVVFLVSAATVPCAALVASWLMTHPATAEGYPK